MIQQGLERLLHWVLAAFTEQADLVPRTHMASHNSLLLQIQEFWCLLDSAGTCMNTVSDVIIVMKGRPDWKQVLLSSQESCQITCAPCHPGKHWDIVRTWKCCTYFALKNHWEILNNNHIVAIHHKKIPRLFSMIALFYEVFCLHFQLYQAV